MSQRNNIIYLASKSPRRRELLKQIGIQFELLMMREQSPRVDVDEAPLLNETAHVYVQRESEIARLIWLMRGMAAAARWDGPGRLLRCKPHVCGRLPLIKTNAVVNDLRT